MKSEFQVLGAMYFEFSAVITATVQSLFGRVDTFGVEFGLSTKIGRARRWKSRKKRNFQPALNRSLATKGGNGVKWSPVGPFLNNNALAA